MLYSICLHVYVLLHKLIKQKKLYGIYKSVNNIKSSICSGSDITGL